VISCVEFALQEFEILITTYTYLLTYM